MHTFAIWVSKKEKKKKNWPQAGTIWKFELHVLKLKIRERIRKLRSKGSMRRTAAIQTTSGSHHFYKLKKNLEYFFLPHPELLESLNHLLPSDWKSEICWSYFSWCEYVHVCGTIQKEKPFLLWQLIADHSRSNFLDLYETGKLLWSWFTKFNDNNLPENSLMYLISCFSLLEKCDMLNLLHGRSRVHYSYQELSYT